MKRLLPLALLALLALPAVPVRAAENGLQWRGWDSGLREAGRSDRPVLARGPGGSPGRAAQGPARRRLADRTGYRAPGFGSGLGPLAARDRARRDRRPPPRIDLVDPARSRPADPARGHVRAWDQRRD